MDKVWIVGGTVGEYSDRSEWPVRAFALEAEAQTFCDELSALSRDAGDGMRRYQHSPAYMEADFSVSDKREEEIAAQVKALDPAWSTYCGEGATYALWEIPFGPTSSQDQGEKK